MPGEQDEPVDFLRTHSIGALLALCKETGIDGAEDLLDATSLTRYAVVTRYPGQEDPIDREEAREAAALAAQVFNWGLSRILAPDDEEQSGQPASAP